jgi:hypothetical protein
VSLRLLRGLLAITLTAWGGQAAWADRDVRVEVAGEAPVTAQQLAAALRVRVAATGPAIVVQLRPASDGVVARIADRERDVALGGRTGEDAARLIALAIADLALDDVGDEVGVGGPSLTAAMTPAPAGLGRRHGTELTVSFLGMASAWSSVMASGGVDVTVGRGAWLAAAEVQAGQLIDGNLELGGALVRLAAGWRSGVLELRAGATVAPVWISNGAGDRTVLAGAGASARLRAPVTKDVRLVLAVGVDGFATQSEYRIQAPTMVEQVSTPWLAPWIAVGAEVTP